MSPPPFGTIFRVETEEKLKGVEWDFGDGEVSEGERVGHTFRDRGTFRVVAQVRNEAGDIATLSKVVRVVDTLKLPDLGFDGEPKVENQKMSGEVPVTVNLEPRTSVPLIEFFWEAPKATVVEEKNTILKAVYRKQGTYIVTLIGQDPDGRVMRLPITLEVTPPSSLMSIRMNPDGGVAPLVVRFDASESVIPGQEISGFVWTFGDEEDKEMAKEAGAQVEHIFENPGTYTVGLKAFTTSGKEFTAEKTIVVRAPILEACFTASRTKGPAPLGVEFNRKCTTGNAVKVLWDFGDGGQSNELTDSVIHVFEKRGEFKVKLSLEDDVGGRSKYMLTITAQ